MRLAKSRKASRRVVWDLLSGECDPAAQIRFNVTEVFGRWQFGFGSALPLFANWNPDRMTSYL